MESLEDPPSAAELRRKAPLSPYHLPVGSLLWRIFAAAGPHPVTWNELRSFGPTGSRFDHHPPDPPPRVHPKLGILYAAAAPPTVFAEYFQSTGIINRRLNEPWIVQFALASPLTLLDVTGEWGIKAKAGAAIASGKREQSRKWSRAIYEAYPDIHGICYRSSLNPAWLAFALYERAKPALPPLPLLHAPLTDMRIEPLVAQAKKITDFPVI